MDRFTKWAEKEYPLLARILGTLPAGVLVVVLIPILISIVGPALDRLLSISIPQLGIWPLLIGGILVLTGVFFALWSITDQFIKARGTPLPMMATQKLLVSGPFKYCRNPMSFGTILSYLGFTIFLRSPGALVVVIALSVLLLTYIARIEERELEARFGEAYRSYKKKTPFLIPRIFQND
jgi:protein-S-isoprenylcysteine O-methyltransferase Ste14